MGLVGQEYMNISVQWQDAMPQLCSVSFSFSVCLFSIFAILQCLYMSFNLLYPDYIISQDSSELFAIIKTISNSQLFVLIFPNI